MRGISLGWAIAIAAVFQVNAPALVQQLTMESTSIDVLPLQDDWSIYTAGGEGAANVVGVLTTAILLSLGAPLWYRALIGLAFWRDRVTPATAGVDVLRKQRKKS